MNIQCNLCQIEFKDHFNAFSNHLKLHKFTSKTYYDRFVKITSEGKCINCNKETAFRGFFTGYQKFCGRKCSAKISIIKQWTGEKGIKRKKNLSKKMMGNNHSIGRPKGSKNINPYPMTEAVINRINTFSVGNTYWKGKQHSLETREKMSITRVKLIKENGGFMAYKGKYRPKNPEKYLGESKNIVYRSLWERKMMKFFDFTPTVLAWSSEETIVPYHDPVKGHTRRYFVDFFCKIKQADETIKDFLVEIKPYNQIKEPKVRTRKTRKYAKEVMTYMTNISKWKAAKLYCAQRGWEFLVLSEYEIGIKNTPKNGYISPDKLLEKVYNG